MTKKEKPALIKILLWLFSVATMIGLMILSGRFFEESSISLLIESAIIAAVTLIYLYLISGKKTFSFMFNKTGYTIRKLFPTLIVSIIFALMGVLSFVFDRPPLNPNWIKDIALSAASFFFVGIYEEGCFRACACDALLPAFKKSKHPFLLTAIVSGLVFGYVHVVSADFSDLQQTLQFFLKIANTALYGAAFMILYWKTRNLFALGFVHGLNDFIPDFIDKLFLFRGQTNEATYTTGDSGTTIAYAVQLVIEILVLIYIYRKVGRKIDYQKKLEEW
ncbi:MAG: CPBP family intramembrane metalloprotease [Erysipelotrichaceae bacterium]|nr:CPBP family intramembrane metalloprotease [Erysipelotrichaceae bacterium]